MMILLYLDAVEDHRLAVLLRGLADAFSVGQQERANVDQLLDLLGATLGGLADDGAAQAVSHEHDGFGLSVEHLDDAPGIALHRDLGGRSVVLAVPW